DLEKLIDALVVDLEFIKIEIMQTGQPADGRSNRAVAAFATIDYPLLHAHVVAETGPEKFSARAFAEPVHVENKRRFGQPFPDREPVPKIIADVVAAEREHRHRVAPNLSDRASRGGGCFRRHGGAEINAVFPIKRLKHKRQRSAATSAENNGADRNAF